MDPTFSDIGLAGILIVLVLREVFGFLRSKHGPIIDCTRMANQVDDLHKWHAPDSRGRMDWKGNHEMTLQLATIASELREILVELRRNK